MALVFGDPMAVMFHLTMMASHQSFYFTKDFFPLTLIGFLLSSLNFF
jgi:hypothetical protein